MTHHARAVRIALLLIFALPLYAQRRVAIPAVRFEGAPQYTQEELLAAAGLKPNERLSPAQVKAHARLLNDTGLFQEVQFRSSRKTLLFILTPTRELFPMHLENLPLTPGKELDVKLHERFPLYRGLLPASGSIVDGICRFFEQMLAVQGAQATVKAALTSGLGPHKLTAVNFSVVSPPVRIGRIQLAGISPAMQAKVSLVAGQQTGNSFDTENTAAGLERAFVDIYHDQGYAAVHVDVARVDPLVVSAQSIEVPFAVRIEEGGIYKLGRIDLPPGALVTRAEVEKAVSKGKAGAGRPLDLFVLAVRDAYSAHGYLDCSIVLRPSFDEARHVVNYMLEIAPGAQYRFATVAFDGAPQAMAVRLEAAWKMAPGDVFDESYLSHFEALAQKKDKPLSKWMQTVTATYDFKADSATHQVHCIFHFAKPVEGSR